MVYGTRPPGTNLNQRGTHDAGKLNYALIGFLKVQIMCSFLRLILNFGTIQAQLRHIFMYCDCAKLEL